MMQFLIYVWQNWDDLNAEWLRTFTLGRSGPARRGQQGYHHINTAIEQLQQILDNPSSHWVNLFLKLGIASGSQLRPAQICSLPQSMCFRLILVPSVLYPVTVQLEQPNHTLPQPSQHPSTISEPEQSQEESIQPRINRQRHAIRRRVLSRSVSPNEVLVPSQIAEHPDPVSSLHTNPKNPNTYYCRLLLATF